MASSDEEDGSLDGVILQIFEEHTDKFTFPLTTQKQTRDFVRLLNRKGFDYEMIAEAVGEKLTYFQSWRLGSDSSSIGARVLKRINRPLQDAMLSDDDDKVVDKVKKLLFNGMSVDIDDADGALDAIDDKRRKMITEANAKANIKNKEKELLETEKCTDTTISSSSQKPAVAETKEVKNAAPAEKFAIKDDIVSSKKSPTAKNTDVKKPAETDTKLSVPSKSDGSNLLEKEKVEEIKSLETLKMDQTNIKLQQVTDSNASKHVSTGTSNVVAVTKSDATLKSLNAVDTDSKAGSNNVVALTASEGSIKSKNKEKLTQATSKSELPIEPPSSPPVTKLPDSLPVKPAQVPRAPLESVPIANNQTSTQASTPTSDDVGVHQLKVSFGAKTSVASPTSGSALEKASDLISPGNAKGSNSSVKTNEPSSPKTVKDKPISKLDGLLPLKTEQGISPSMVKTLPSIPPTTVDSVNKLSEKTEKSVRSKVTEVKPTISWTDSIDSSTASESESSSSSSGISSSKLTTKPTSPSAKAESKCTARVLPAVSKQPPPESESNSNAWISDENYDSDLDWDEMNKLLSPTPQAKLVDNIRLFKKSVSEVDGPGFIYVMSDTAGSKPIATLDGTHRVKIGASRFPLKRYEQAKAFNPDIKLLTSVPVQHRRGAVQHLSAELSSMTYRDIQGWYRGSIVKILQSIEDLDKS